MLVSKLIYLYFKCDVEKKISYSDIRFLDDKMINRRDKFLPIMYHNKYMIDKNYLLYKIIRIF